MADEILDARDAALTKLFLDSGALGPKRPNLATAVAQHVARVEGPAGWMLDGVTIPSGIITEWPAASGSYRPGVSVVLPRSTGGAFSTGVSNELARLKALVTNPGMTLEGLNLSIQGTRPQEELANLIGPIGESSLPQELTLFVEVPIGDRPAGEVLQLIRAIAEVADTPAPGGRTVVAKARFGGVGSTPAPGYAETAGFLMACADLRVPVAIGPGLVDPVPKKGSEGHGFLNMLAAGVMAHRGNRMGQLRLALSAGADRVRLGSGALIVGDEVIESEVLAACRRDFLVSISCLDLSQTVAGLAAIGAVTNEGVRA